ncbi:calcium-binding protein 5-like protein [Cinnamomum micranthum f. kanehirae]|uniref:Calcium-binding protein 5-like protein n=1 Tax=Cinnamomum micranthum f. kanehirae TaxID=337451 RepID=A0A3S3N2B6_9MAGN|nr:calcium-binding protein 5-like protein [Cinnamomum micranthum f. kanehirae]
MAIRHRGICRSNSEMTVDEFKDWLKQFDANGDGRISRDELRSAIRRLGGWFTTWKSGKGMQQADINGNGFIDEGEVDNLITFAQKNLGMKIITY